MMWLLGLIALLLAGCLYLLFEIYHTLHELKKVVALKALRDEERASGMHD